MANIRPWCRPTYSVGCTAFCSAGDHIYRDFREMNFHCSFFSAVKKVAENHISFLIRVRLKMMRPITLIKVLPCTLAICRYSPKWFTEYYYTCTIHILYRLCSHFKRVLLPCWPMRCDIYEPEDNSTIRTGSSSSLLKCRLLFMWPQPVCFRHFIRGNVSTFAKMSWKRLMYRWRGEAEGGRSNVTDIERRQIHKFKFIMEYRGIF